VYLRCASLVALGALSLTGCGGRSELTGAQRDASAGCFDPPSVVPDAGSLDLPFTPYETFQVRFHNHCAETIWPAWVRADGLDQTVPDPTLWAPVLAGEERAVTIYYIVFAGIELWGRTGCRFDAQGKGACDTGDCAGFVCFTQGDRLPLKATVYDSEYGFLAGGYNLPISVETPGCATQACAFDLATCPGASRVTGACGGVACTGMCQAGAPSSCCHPTSNGCFKEGDVDFTFCP